jgi:hypothetical protein
MSMPKPVCPNMAAATPIGLPGAQTPQKQHAPGCSSWTPSHPPAESVFPRAWHGRSLPRCGELSSRTPARHRAPNREPGRILIPGDGAAGDQGLRIGLPARQWRLRDACGLSRLNDFLALWSQAYMPSYNRQVTSTSVHMAKPGPAGARRGHAPLQADPLSLARTISDRRVCIHWRCSGCRRACEQIDT